MFCVAVGFAGRLPVAQVRGAEPGGVPWFASALCVATPAHAGNIFSKNGMGWTWLTSVGVGWVFACFDSIVAAWKYVIPLAGSFRFVGIAKSTCIGRRRPMLPT